MQKYEVKGHEPSYLPEGKWKLVWSDEFDGTELDRSKWDYRLHLGGKRHETYIENAISFDGNSNIIFHLIEQNGNFYSSALQTGENYTDRPNGESKNIKPKFLHKYGYYECRCKLQHEMPWWSAFWIQAQNVALLDDPKTAGVEIDIMESFRPGFVIPHFIHWGGYGEGHKFKNTMGVDRMAQREDGIPLDLNTYHTFGLEWDEDGYTFYIDGKQSGIKIDGPVSDVEQFILLSTECKGYRKTPAHGFEGADVFEKNGSSSTDSFIVDYVRVFDKII